MFLYHTPLDQTNYDRPYHPDDFVLDEADRLGEDELVALTGHSAADLREWDQ